jgi:hypothetical protein
MSDHGFITLHRRVFKHALFKNDRPFSRFHAWVWLISSAAWCPCQRKVARKLVTLDRGQLATTTRELAKAWGWHRSKVERFLRVLRADAMIRTRAGETLTETVTETPRRGVITIITICNYSTFQDLPTGQDSAPRQSARQKPRRGAQQELDLNNEIAPQPINHSNQELKEQVEGGEGKKRKEIRGVMGRKKPRHGQRSMKNGTIWIDLSSDEWAIYAADFKSVTGTAPLPQSYIGGAGRWFDVFGAGAKPVQQQRSAARAQLDSAILASKRKSA